MTLTGDMEGDTKILVTDTCLRLDGGGGFAPASSKYSTASWAVTVLF